MKGGADVSKYSAEQLRWCRMYEAETGWPALMQDFESGNETFYEAARKSVGWFESWASDALLRITASELPGKPQLEARTYDDARYEAPNLHCQVYLSARLRGATHEGANALAEYAEGAYGPEKVGRADMDLIMSEVSDGTGESTPEAKP